MAILNENDFIDVTETVEKLDIEGPNFNKKYFESGSSSRLVEYINQRGPNTPVSFSNCVLSNLKWMEKRILGKVNFRNCLFKGGETSFEKSTFNHDVSFDRCVFSDTVSFDNTVFVANASFKEIHTVGDAKSAFLFRGNTIQRELHPAYNYSLDFSSAVFENNAVFNYRHFNKCTSFTGADFKYYFFFLDADLGFKTIFENVTFSCVEDLKHNPTLERPCLIRCFENFLTCLENANHRCFKQHIEQILYGLAKQAYENWDNDGNKRDKNIDPENEFVTVRYIMGKNGWEARTLSAYASKYPYYFEVSGSGKNRKYRWSKIQEFLDASPEEKAKHLRSADPNKNKKKGCKYVTKC